MRRVDVKAGIVSGALYAALLIAPVRLAADAAGTESAEGLRLAAHDPLQARQTYQIVQHRQGDRWLLYLGHLRGSELNPLTGEVEENGSSVVDVTDPRNPEFLLHIPPTPAPWFESEAIDASGGQHVQACSGDELPGGEAGRHYLLRNQGMIADEVLDVTDPLHPRLVSQVVRTQRARDGKLRTHKNFWDCATGEAYLVTSVAGWTGQVLQVFDLADPARPRHIRDFGLPGTQPGGPDFCERGVFGPHSPHASHNPLYEGKLVFLAYFTGGVRVIDMRDPFKPVEVGHFIAEATPNSRVIYPPNAGPDVEPWPVANTVEIDERGGYVFMADRPHNGLYILELNGAVKALAEGR